MQTAVTVTPGNTPPVLSVTVPEISPVVFCAKTFVVASTVKSPTNRLDPNNLKRIRPASLIDSIRVRIFYDHLLSVKRLMLVHFQSDALGAIRERNYEEACHWRSIHRLGVPISNVWKRWTFCAP